MPTIEWIAVDALKPNARNARTHSKKQIRQIADSIAAFGFLVPILIDEGGVIIAGHGRYAAAKLARPQTGAGDPRWRAVGSQAARASPLPTTRSPRTPAGTGSCLAVELPELAELLIDEGWTSRSPASHRSRSISSTTDFEDG